jgi:hypothetical protein
MASTAIAFVGVRVRGLGRAGGSRRRGGGREVVVVVIWVGGRVDVARGVVGGARLQVRRLELSRMLWGDASIYRASLGLGLWHGWCRLVGPTLLGYVGPATEEYPFFLPMFSFVF